MDGNEIVSEQLLLFRPRADLSFDNFFVTANNETIVSALQQWLCESQGGIFYLHGPSGSGRSHLLQAACRDQSAVYLPLQELHEHEPAQVLDGLEIAQLICLDDIDAVLSSDAWCEQIFYLFNRIAAAKHKLLVSAKQAAANIVCPLPDLRSRLSLGGGFRVAPLDDESIGPALRLRAHERGVDLGDDVVTYLLTRYSRSFDALLTLLNELDRHSMAEQKRITIPFVRKFLGSHLLISPKS